MTYVLKGCVILAALAVSIGVGVFHRIGMDLHKAPFQPRGAAFSIWGLIYLTICISAVAIIYNNLSWYPVAFLALSLVCCSGWLGTVNLKDKNLSMLFIVFAALNALASVALIPLDMSDAMDWVVSTGPSLLAGWLSVAVGLGINIAYHAQTGNDISGWILAPGGILAAVVGIMRGSPLIGLPLVWASIFSTPSRFSVTVGSIGVLTVVVATIRGLHLF